VTRHVSQTRGITDWLGDLIGFCLFAAAITWTYFAASATSTIEWWAAGALLIASVSFTIGRIAAARRRLVYSIILLAGVVLAVDSSDSVFTSAPTSGPFGYSNATGAFYVQVALAGLALFLNGSSSWTKSAALVSCMGSSLIVVTTHSAAATLLLVALPGLALLIAWRRSPGGATFFCAGVVALAVVGSIALAAFGRAIGGEELGGRRVALWRDAFALMSDHPWVGVGRGRFERSSALALSDEDIRHVHNEYLQEGAEAGVVGLLLLLLIFLWGFARLWSISEPDLTTVLAAAALGCLGVHASVDYVLHFPLIVGAAALVVGTGAAAPMSPKRPPFSTQSCSRSRDEAGSHSDQRARTRRSGTAARFGCPSP
jgi:O-antigen ligase